MESARFTSDPLRDAAQQPAAADGGRQVRD